MNLEELGQAIDALPGDKVTAEQITARIIGVVYMMVPRTTVTIAHIGLENGYSVRGESACVDPANYNEEIGAKLAYLNAYEKLWALEGYLLAEQRWKDGRFVQPAPGVVDEPKAEESILILPN